MWSTASFLFCFLFLLGGGGCFCCCACFCAHYPCYSVHLLDCVDITRDQFDANLVMELVTCDTMATSMDEWVKLCAHLICLCVIVHGDQTIERPTACLYACVQFSVSLIFLWINEMLCPGWWYNMRPAGVPSPVMWPHGANHPWRWTVLWDLSGCRWGQVLLPGKNVPGQFFSLSLMCLPSLSLVSFLVKLPWSQALQPRIYIPTSVFVHLLLSLFLIFFLMRLAVQRPNVTTTREGHCRSVIISDLFPCQAMQRSRVSTAWCGYARSVSRALSFLPLVLPSSFLSGALSWMSLIVISLFDLLSCLNNALSFFLKLAPQFASACSAQCLLGSRLCVISFCIWDVVLQPGEKWIVDECTRCQCQGGAVSCSVQRCPVQDCGQNEIRATSPGQCCPVCLKREWNQKQNLQRQISFVATKRCRPAVCVYVVVADSNICWV